MKYAEERNAAFLLKTMFQLPVCDPFLSSCSFLSLSEYSVFLYIESIFAIFTTERSALNKAPQWGPSIGMKGEGGSLFWCRHN
jgi:hypothetical protein